MPTDASKDASPLTPAVCRALVATASSELRWAAKVADDELRRWRRRATTIPDPTLRHEALAALANKRGHADGAALFAVLPRRRDERLVRTLLVYELIVDYLDGVHERHPDRESGLALHEALQDATDLSRPVGDYYRLHPWSDDAGYLAAMVITCRQGVSTLPAFTRVAAVVRRECRRALVLALNHEPDPVRRDAALVDWAAREHPDGRLPWFEASAAASATLLVLAALALAADADLTSATVTALDASYMPAIVLTTTMLDSYADLAADAASGAHSYLRHYDSAEIAIARLHDCISTSMRQARALPGGGRHAVIVGCMIALFLSADGANSPELRETTRALARSGGSLVRLLVPILRIWRRVHRQSS